MQAKAVRLAVEPVGDSGGPQMAVARRQVRSMLNSIRRPVRTELSGHTE